MTQASGAIDMPLHTHGNPDTELGRALQPQGGNQYGTTHMTHLQRPPGAQVWEGDHMTAYHQVLGNPDSGHTLQTSFPTTQIQNGIEWTNIPYKAPSAYEMSSGPIASGFDGLEEVGPAFMSGGDTDMPDTEYTWSARQSDNWQRHW